ncbi:class A beta-lactamase-related serine hydrolase [Umezakia ovalisporum]|jgi:beta-lactamase class A|uniref:class A beta-lactamase-related serine hydrolase n=1 Tax=Umezakia ovalisporum TaxID=75695 RepID=UPI000A470CA6|nr:class A beta-lactamase-related serine hydrolase [Umezakia ovalisporum]MDH6084923.1 class A beta-lactamase-related serine hydrolase [Umezakia ovalisporum TAC611]MDH6089345.1 class A beta-lactamase-related serine hydrolase [Umezakia ovalisporum Ak1311]
MLGRESAVKHGSKSQGVTVSESTKNLRNLSRGQPTKPPQAHSQGQKVTKKKIKVPLKQQRPIKKEVALTRSHSNIIPGLSPAEVGRLKSRPVMPPGVKPIAYVNKMTPPLPAKTVRFKTPGVEKQLNPKLVKRISRKTRLKPMARTALYALRLLIVGVGVGAIVGTILSVFDPATRMSSNSVAQSHNTGQNTGQNQPQPMANLAPGGLYLSQEITPLKDAVQNLATANPNLKPGVFFVDLETGGYVDVNSSISFPAASTIKVPILIAFFQDVDAGKVRLDEMLTMEKDMVATGSGNLQHQQVGTQYSALELATLMSTTSDNTATNMLIARLGGIQALNQRFQSWGLSATALRNPLPDLTGTNTTSPKELGNLLAMVNQGNLVTMRSRDLILDIMRRTERNHLLPSGLGVEATIHHKTGDIATMLGDVGLIDIPTGKRYIAVVMIQRSNNDPGAEKLISSISRTAYEQFSQNVPNSVMNLPGNQNMSTTITPNPIPPQFSTPQSFPSR